VEITNVSGPAADWLKLLFITQLALGTVLIVLISAVLVVTLWRGR